MPGKGPIEWTPAMAAVQAAIDETFMEMQAVQQHYIAASRALRRDPHVWIERKLLMLGVQRKGNAVIAKWGTTTWKGKKKGRGNAKPFREDIEPLTDKTRYSIPRLQKQVPAGLYVAVEEAECALVVLRRRAKRFNAAMYQLREAEYDRQQAAKRAADTAQEAPQPLVARIVDDGEIGVPAHVKRRDGISHASGDGKWTPEELEHRRLELLLPRTMPAES